MNRRRSSLSVVARIIATIVAVAALVGCGQNSEMPSGLDEFINDLASSMPQPSP